MFIYGNDSQTRTSCECINGSSLIPPTARTPNDRGLLAGIGAICLLAMPNGLDAFQGQKQAILSVARRQGTASWYSNTSAKRENTCHVGQHGSCLTASGEELDDQAYTAASWDYPFGTVIQVTRTSNSLLGTSKSVPQTAYVTVSDRGPAKRFYRQGRILDLSAAAFQAVCGDLRQGICQVSVQPVSP